MERGSCVVGAAFDAMRGKAVVVGATAVCYVQSLIARLLNTVRFVRKTTDTDKGPCAKKVSLDAPMLVLSAAIALGLTHTSIEPKSIEPNT